MTLSVGLGKIINDPDASIRTRKALGALSTPGLLVTDQGLTIDGDGRMVLRLKPGGGIIQDETGLSITGSSGSFGVIKVDGITGGVAAGSGVWNVYLTGTAQNYFAGSIGIGVNTEVLPAKLTVRSSTEQLRLEYDDSNYCTITVGATGNTTIEAVGTNASISFIGTVSIGSTALTAKLSVLSTTEQQRLLYDASNYCKTTVGATGLTTIAAVGTNASIDLDTPAGKGVTINGGSPILKVLYGSRSGIINLDGTTQNVAVNVPGAAVGDPVFASPDGTPGAGINGWSAGVFGIDTVQVRITTNNIGGTDTRNWRVVVIQF